MDLIEEMIEQIDEILNNLNDHDELFSAMELAQQLRDELYRYTMMYNDNDE